MEKTVIKEDKAPYEPSDKDIDYILKQAPADSSRDKVIEILKETHGNLLDTLSIIYDCETKEDKIIYSDLHKNKINELREIADDLDKQMEKIINQKSNHMVKKAKEINL